MIQLNNINFNYAGDIDSGGLSNINLNIPDGQIILLCGKSGCGKTTLTRIINGLIPSFYEGELSGEVLVDGIDISNCSLYQTAKIVGSVFQNPRTQFFAVDSTSEMAFGCENQGLPEKEIIKRIWNTANSFNIQKLMGKNIFEMSGGEKQKVACASVSVSEPQIIVLDEPSANLDITATRDLRNMISIWKKQGKTIVIAEHRLHYLFGLLDRIIYLKDGAIDSEFSEQEFQKLTNEKQMDMGLRPFELSHFGVSQRAISKCKSFVLSDFRFSYGKDKALLNVENLELPQNSIIALIGHNGAGKSTLARCLCGLERRCKGVLLMNGQKYSRKQRLRNCYMIMQDVNHQLFTESVEEEVLISMIKPDKTQTVEILERLDLKALSSHHPMALSGGQKQRVAIASALVSNREILIFDEPTSGLDLQHMSEVSNELLKLQEMGKTSIVITHDYELIVSCCTYILHLEHGAVKEQYELNQDGMNKLKRFFIS